MKSTASFFSAIKKAHYFFPGLMYFKYVVKLAGRVLCSMTTSVEQAFNHPQSLLTILRIEWRWWLIGGIVSFIAASILMSGWPNGIWPELFYPYTYQDDGLSHSWLTLRAMEGWVFDNPRSGYPFGSSFLDYPGSDFGNLLLLKFLGSLTGSYYSALNLFFLFSFPAVFITAFCALRALELCRALAISAAFLFTFLPFHFQRLEHLFYLWYFVVPLFYYLCFKVYCSNIGFIKKDFYPKKLAILFVLLLGLASFGVYYALFGLILLAASATAAFMRTKRSNSLFYPSILIIMISIGVLLNVTPNLFNKYSNGINSEVAVRSPADAEIYGLKFMQLALPRLGHRNEQFAAIASDYAKVYPLVNENSTANLGLVGTIGFIGAFLLLIAGMAGRQIDRRLSLLAISVFVLFMFGTIGGFGAFFSSVISPSIRGWNRISVFIAFASITLFFLAVQIFVTHYFSKARARIVIVSAALFFCSIGLYDQTAPACLTCNEKTRIAFHNDKEFVTKLEQMVPPGSAIYQLPYMPFPESTPLYRLQAYDLLTGFLHSKELRWSYAGMKGRQGDLFYRALADESIEKQLDVIRRLGFAGIYLDRRGFQDNADSVLKQLTEQLGYGPSLKRADDEVVFFPLQSMEPVQLDGLRDLQIMQKGGYVLDKHGPRYEAILSDGIDFTRRVWPNFIKDVHGLSERESWGRWSDARLEPGVKFDFINPLPDQFTLVLSARPFGRNGEQTVLIRVGDQIHRVLLQSPETLIRLPIALSGVRANSIEFIPQEPQSPQELGTNTDKRKLGIGFVHMRIEE